MPAKTPGYQRDNAFDCDRTSPIFAFTFLPELCKLELCRQAGAKVEARNTFGRQVVGVLQENCMSRNPSGQPTRGLHYKARVKPKHFNNRSDEARQRIMLLLSCADRLVLVWAVALTCICKPWASQRSFTARRNA